MYWIVKLIISASVISLASWLAEKKPVLAGFLIALPLSSLLALALNHVEYRDASKSIIFAKSIFAAVPLSLLFFIPFLFAERFRFGFWTLYVGGIGLLGIAYLLHSWIFR